MGCSNPNEEESINAMRNKLNLIISKNNSKYNTLNQQLTKLDMEISQLESDIVQNQFILSEEELKSKARILAEKKKDRIRKDKEIKHLVTLNDTMKNNLNMIELKIEEYRNAKSIEEANQLMNSIKMDFNKIFSNNVNNLLKQKQKDEENMRVLEQGNQLYLNDKDNMVEDPDDILKNLIGNKGANIPSPNPAPIPNPVPTPNDKIYYNKI